MLTADRYRPGKTDTAIENTRPSPSGVPSKSWTGPFEPRARSTFSPAECRYVHNTARARAEIFRVTPAESAASPVARWRPLFSDTFRVCAPLSGGFGRKRNRHERRLCRTRRRAGLLDIRLGIRHSIVYTSYPCVVAVAGARVLLYERAVGVRLRRQMRDIYGTETSCRVNSYWRRYGISDRTAGRVEKRFTVTTAGATIRVRRRSLGRIVGYGAVLCRDDE